jgi:toxin-antitoxin system PIN domain toxin
MRALFDVDVLLALFDQDHSLHAQVRNWWADNNADGWATCPLTQNGFTRVMSQPGYPKPRPIADVMQVLRLGLDQANHEFWPDGISITDAEMFDRTHILGPRQITDVYLLGLAMTNGGRLVTFDRGVPLKAVRSAEARHLIVL